MPAKDLILAAFAASLMSIASVTHAQDEVKINAVPVTENIYMLTGQGGNIGLFLGKDGSFIVDDQFAPLTEKILAAISRLVVIRRVF